MPLDTNEVLRVGTEFLEQERNNPSNSGNPSGEGEWSKLFQTHSEGGGPFGGRDNALTKLVGFFRAKSFPYDAALSIAHIWNEMNCDPPLLARDIHDKMGRGWAQWSEGGHEDLTPEDLKAKKPEPEKKVLEFKTSDDLLALAASGGGMQWLVPNVLVRGGVHFLTAPAAGCKTFLMIELARCVAGGKKWLESIPVVQGAVLYVDEEMGDEKMASRVRKLGVEAGLLFYYLGKQRVTLSNDAQRQQIVEFCTEKQVVLLILDTLTGVHPGLKENESEHVSLLRRYFADFTTAGITVLVAHHDRKGGKGDGSAEHERMAGSRDLAAMADMAYAIDRKGDFFHLGVSKNRLLSDDDAISVNFCLEDNEDKTHVVIRLVDAEVKTEKFQGRVRMKIAEVLLKHGELTTTRLSELCEIRKASIVEVLKSMGESGEVAIKKDGRFTLYYLVETTPF